MKFHLQNTGTLLVTGCGDGWVRINADEHRSNVLVTPDAVLQGWAPEGFAALAEADFGALLVHQPEIVLVGTGTRQQFAHPRLTRPLLAARVGVEMMDTRAACRTFNILTGEGRRVIAALIVTD
jgi:uncharacterized protein